MAGFLKTLFTKQGPGERPDTVLDALVYFASLASNPSGLDVELDRVRVVTASISPGEAPTKDQERVLYDVYLQVERYLTTKEVMRKFTKEELRSKLGTSVVEGIIAYEHETK
jgi:DNA-binding transcriptional regulator YbjK